jgi:hypothetical protein
VNPGAQYLAAFVGCRLCSASSALLATSTVISQSGGGSGGGRGSQLASTKAGRCGSVQCSEYKQVREHQVSEVQDTGGLVKVCELQRECTKRQPSSTQAPN